jgi:tryptophan synthase alpha chain
MGRIEERFEALKKEGRKALVAYLTAGDPDLKTTAKLIPALEAAGVDIVEIGVPFSDPTADGPTIQAASQRALKRGATLAKILAMIASLRRKSGIPIVLFGYYNPILSYGPEKFAADAKRSGVDGLLVVDLPPEEADELRRYTDPAGLAFITLIAPTTDPDRVAKILRGAAGFVYFISVTGVTGTATPRTEDIRNGLAGIKRMTTLPIAVGFGISTPEQAAVIAPLADGIVVGSALVRLIAEKNGSGDITQAVSAFAAKIRRAIDTPTPAGKSGGHG